MRYALFNPVTGVYRCALESTLEDLEEQKAKMLMIFPDNKAEDWVKISEEDFAKYMLGTSGGDNGTGYIRDLTTGKCISAPARVYTYAEKISNVMTEFNSQANILKGELATAQIAGDDADIQRCKDDYSALVESSTAKLYEVINE